MSEGLEGFSRSVNFFGRRFTQILRISTYLSAFICENLRPVFTHSYWEQLYYIEPTELDLLIFEKLVPTDHYLRQVKAIIDFEFVRSAVQD
jgi:hypothetical protein